MENLSDRRCTIHISDQKFKEIHEQVAVMLRIGEDEASKIYEKGFYPVDGIINILTKSRKDLCTKFAIEEIKCKVEEFVFKRRIDLMTMSLGHYKSFEMQRDMIPHHRSFNGVAINVAGHISVGQLPYNLYPDKMIEFETRRLEIQKARARIQKNEVEVARLDSSLQHLHPDVILVNVSDTIGCLEAVEKANSREAIEARIRQELGHSTKPRGRFTDEDRRFFIHLIAASPEPISIKNGLAIGLKKAKADTAFSKFKIENGCSQPGKGTGEKWFMEILQNLPQSPDLRDAAKAEITAERKEKEVIENFAKKFFD